MISVLDLQTYLINGTNLEVEISEDSIENLFEEYELPRLFINYTTINSEHTNYPVETTILNTQGENLIQVFEFNLICSFEEFTDNWILIYSKMIGKNLYPNEYLHTGFTYFQGGRKRSTKERIWWIDLWNLGFPTATSLYKV